MPPLAEWSYNEVSSTFWWSTNHHRLHLTSLAHTLSRKDIFTLKISPAIYLGTPRAYRNTCMDKGGNFKRVIEWTGQNIQNDMIASVYNLRRWYTRPHVNYFHLLSYLYETFMKWLINTHAYLLQMYGENTLHPPNSLRRFSRHIHSAVLLALS